LAFVYREVEVVNRRQLAVVLRQAFDFNHWGPRGGWEPLIGGFGNPFRVPMLIGRAIMPEATRVTNRRSRVSIPAQGRGSKAGPGCCPRDLSSLIVSGRAHSSSSSSPSRSSRARRIRAEPDTR